MEYVVGYQAQIVRPKILVFLFLGEYSKSVCLIVVVEIEKFRVTLKYTVSLK